MSAHSRSFLLAAGLISSACSGPQSALDPAGPAALAAAWLWWAMFAFSTIVLVAVVVVWLYAIFRRSQPNYDKAATRRVARRWIVGGGVILPLASTTLLLIFGIPAGHRMLPLPSDGPPPMVIEVVGHQWWWEVRYPDSGVITANELHLPVDVPVDVHVTSADVIHSFWVPSLAGKIDVLPARTHIQRLQANRTGFFRGQCAEFCGLLHAHMILAVEVHSAEDFAAWLQARAQDVRIPPQHETGAAAFMEHCGDCHRVAGITGGQRAPDLSNIGARAFVGGRPRTQELGVGYWLENHPQVQAGAPIPDHSNMAEGDLDDIAEWLETLGHE